MLIHLNSFVLLFYFSSISSCSSFYRLCTNVGGGNVATKCEVVEMTNPLLNLITGATVLFSLRSQLCKCRFSSREANDLTHSSSSSFFCSSLDCCYYFRPKGYQRFPSEKECCLWVKLAEITLQRSSGDTKNE